MFSLLNKKSISEWKWFKIKITLVCRKSWSLNNCTVNVLSRRSLWSNITNVYFEASVSFNCSWFICVLCLLCGLTDPLRVHSDTNKECKRQYDLKFAKTWKQFFWELIRRRAPVECKQLLGMYKDNGVLEIYKNPT